MDKATIKRFIAWCDSASGAEIAQRRQEIMEAVACLASREGKADARLALRLLDEETLARLELSRIASARGD